MVKTKNPELEQERRQHIMLTVRRLLTDGAHRGVTLDLIAREAGVSKGMLTYYFASKDELVTESIVWFLELQQQALAMVVQDHDTPIPVRLRRLVEIALPDRAQVTSDLRFLVEVWSYAKGRPEAMALVQSSYRRFRDACVAMIDEGAGAATSASKTARSPTPCSTGCHFRLSATSISTPRTFASGCSASSTRSDPHQARVVASHARRWLTALTGEAAGFDLRCRRGRLVGQDRRRARHYGGGDLERSGQRRASGAARLAGYPCSWRRDPCAVAKPARAAA